MGRRGPAPKSARLKLLEGNPGKRPLKKGDPASGTRQSARTARPPAYPTWLGPAAKTEWQRLAPELARSGLLTVLDQAAFALYCETYAQWLECQRALAELGRTYITVSGRLVERPEVEMARKYGRLVRELGAEFGLTPGGRARLSLPDPNAVDECRRCGLPFDICGCR